MPASSSLTQLQAKPESDAPLQACFIHMEDDYYWIYLLTKIAEEIHLNYQVLNIKYKCFAKNPHIYRKIQQNVKEHKNKQKNKLWKIKASTGNRKEL